jgi:hypothetical protein
MTARIVTDEQHAARRVRTQRQGTVRRRFSYWVERLDDTQLARLDDLLADPRALARLLEPSREDAR